MEKDNRTNTPSGGDKRSKPNLWVTFVITALVVLGISLLFNYVKQGLHT